MDLRFTAEELAFRDEVRTFFRSALPDSIHDKMIANKGLAKDDIVTWQRILNTKGWAVANGRWNGAAPAGPRFSTTSSRTSCSMTPAPEPLALQRQRWSGRCWSPSAAKSRRSAFCRASPTSTIGGARAFPNPAPVRTSPRCARGEARRRPLRRQRQKTWTTLAQHADWMFGLVRTDPQAKKQEGVSFLLIDMKTPGITVRPIVTIDGGHEVNEVFFDDVEVPVENLVGEENKGWDYAKYLLGRERTGSRGSAFRRSAFGGSRSSPRPSATAISR